MTSAIGRRLRQLEARQGPREPITIIRLVKVPGHLDAEPDYATVRGVTIQRKGDETADAFMARVEAEAKLAAKPGCVATALVFPRVKPHGTEQAPKALG
jgi:hypothetical protein